jgi:hypothetical protein
MGTLKSEDWEAILTRIAVETDADVQNGTLKPPLRTLITDGDDEVVLETDLEFDATGKPKITMLSPEISLAAIAFPITYAVTDCRGREAEAVFSEEVVRNLRKVS